MAKARVLVVDDAVVIRKLLGDELAADPELEVVVAAHGRLALDKLARTPIDAVILDVEMPELDGLATLKELRKLYPRLPVVMFSTLTERGAEATLDALALGANDYFAKPATSSLAESLAIVRERLIPQLKALIAKERNRARPSAPTVAMTAVRTMPPTLLALGASTGGPNALMDLFAGLPADFPVPIAVVQHMPPMFTRMLAERLAAKSPLPTTEAEDGQALRPGTAVVAPGDWHLQVVRDAAGALRAKLHQGPPENSCRPAVDVLFRSAAAACGAGTLGVVLTGMGQDGLRGAEAVRAAGGRVIAQDEATSVVWGMPGAVARAGLAEAVVPLPALAAAIRQRVRAAAP